MAVIGNGSGMFGWNTEKVLSKVDEDLNKIEARARELERLDCLDYLRNALRVMKAGIPKNATAEQVREVDCMFLQMVIEMIENRKETE